MKKNNTRKIILGIIFSIFIICSIWGLNIESADRDTNGDSPSISQESLEDKGEENLPGEDEKNDEVAKVETEEEQSERDVLKDEETVAGEGSTNSKDQTKPAVDGTTNNTNTSVDNGNNSNDVVPPVTVPPVAKVKYCTIEIRCDTILNNMNKLTSGLASYVPANGVILAKVQMEIYEGETTFDILKRATKKNKIQMEFRNDAVYSGAYIEGINHLYEKDCGPESGWMYMVNGVFPNYGCGNYVVNEGDNIKFVYTCNLGKDVGGGV